MLASSRTSKWNMHTSDPSRIATVVEHTLCRGSFPLPIVQELLTQASREEYITYSIYVSYNAYVARSGKAVLSLMGGCWSMLTDRGTEGPCMKQVTRSPQPEALRKQSRGSHELLGLDIVELDPRRLFCRTGVEGGRDAQTVLHPRTL